MLFPKRIARGPVEMGVAYELNRRWLFSAGDAIAETALGRPKAIRAKRAAKPIKSFFADGDHVFLAGAISDMVAGCNRSWCQLCTTGNPQDGCTKIF